MSFSCSIDTNAILRYLIGDNEPQYKLVAKLLKETDDQIAVADVAVVETVHVMERYYEMSRTDIAEALHGFMNLHVINCNRVMLSEALGLFVKYPAQSFEDCCLVVYAELSGATPLYTFDKKLAKQAPSTQLIV